MTTTTLTTRVTPAVRNRLNVIATQEHRSISQQVALILDEFLKTQTTPGQRTDKTAPISSDVQTPQFYPSTLDHA